jgi:spore coat polysaccharide biosynthesis protein SpsF
MGGRTMTAVFLQVRLSSTRLPGKALLELAGRTVIEHAMEALRPVPTDHHVLLTDAESADTLARYAVAHGFSLFVGDPDDVLSRYAEACRWFDVHTVVRATGDNPLVSSEVAKDALRAHEEAKADYTALTEGPLGTGVEVIDGQVLLEAAREARTRYEREHVTPFVYHRPERYRLRIESVRAAYRLPDARVTLDTEDDYAEIARIYDELYAGAPIDTETLVSFLKTRDGGRHLAGPHLTAGQGSRRNTA